MKNEKNTQILNIVGTEVSKEDRLVEDHQKLFELVAALKAEGKKVVYTMGAYDMFHIGHARYLQKAKECGDILIVGIDSDEFIKATKGDDRPVVPYDERCETLVYNRSVNIVTILRTQTDNDDLMKLMRPDIVVLSFSSAKENFSQYEDRMKKKYGPFCNEVKIFERQAETSTSARIRNVVISGAKTLLKTIENVVVALKDVYDGFHKSNGGHL